MRDSHSDFPVLGRDSSSRSSDVCWEDCPVLWRDSSGLAPFPNLPSPLSAREWSGLSLSSNPDTAGALERDDLDLSQNDDGRSWTPMQTPIDDEAPRYLALGSQENAGIDIFSSPRDRYASVLMQGLAHSNFEQVISVQASSVVEPVIFDTPAEAFPVSCVMDIAASGNATAESATSPVPGGARSQPSKKRRAKDQEDCDGECPAPKRRKNRREQDIVTTLRRLLAEELLLGLEFTAGGKLARIEFDPQWQKQAIDQLNQCVVCRKNDLQTPNAGVPRHNLREFFRYAKVLPLCRRGTRHMDWGSCVWETDVGVANW